MQEDAKKAVDLDPSYFKSYLRLGEAQVELGKDQNCQNCDLIDKGIKHLQRALALCWNMKSSDPKYPHKATFEKEINKQILRARKIRWFKEQELDQIEKNVILQELHSVLKVDEIIAAKTKSE